MIQDIYYAKTSRDFRNVFKLDLRNFIDIKVATPHEVGFDYGKFVNEMFARHYILGEEKSLHDVVMENYGEKGVKIIERIL